MELKDFTDLLKDFEPFDDGLLELSFEPFDDGLLKDFTEGYEAPSKGL